MLALSFDRDICTLIRVSRFWIGLYGILGLGGMIGLGLRGWGCFGADGTSIYS